MIYIYAQEAYTLSSSESVSYSNSHIYKVQYAQPSPFTLSHSIQMDEYFLVNLRFRNCSKDGRPTFFCLFRACVQVKDPRQNIEQYSSNAGCDFTVGSMTSFSCWEYKLKISAVDVAESNWWFYCSIVEHFEAIHWFPIYDVLIGNVTFSISSKPGESFFKILFRM